MSDPFYWRVFNVLLRLLGLGSLFAGSVVLITYGFGLPAPLPGEDGINWAAVVAGAIVGLLGLAFLALRPFRPDRGDVGVRFSGGERRRWWTGEAAGE